MGEKRRVLLLCTRSLLGESLEYVLGQIEDVELIGPWVMDGPVLARLSKDIPDMVLVAEVEGECERPTQLIGQILEHFPDLPVGRIGLADNVIRLYTSRTLPARSTDLIETIRSLPAHQPKARRKARHKPLS